LEGVDEVLACMEGGNYAIFEILFLKLIFIFSQISKNNASPLEVLSLITPV
jgi:hypothetical protein